MIKIDFLQGQGLGNQLWVYAALRSISKKLNMPYIAGSEELFKGAGFLDISFSDSSGTEAESLYHFKEKQFYDPDLKYFASEYDSRVATIKEHTYLEGLFQSEKYFYGFESHLPNWIPLSDKMKEYSLQFSEICVLNIRGGEYKRHGNLILPKSYWDNGMRNIKEQLGVEKFLIVTDDPRYANFLFPNIPVLRGGVAECYAALYGAKSIVVSNSSFSYFPIKTRIDKPFVIAPYQWSRFDNSQNRWAAPANFYKDWHWQDVSGSIIDSNICQNNVNDTLQYYLSEYNVLTQSEVLLKKGFVIPSGIKKAVKILLSNVFPSKFG